MSRPKVFTATTAFHPDPTASDEAAAHAPPVPSPSFAGQTLVGRDFSGQDLTGADFTGANLLRADLSGANLAEANLEGAELAGANLRGAHLENVHASNAGLGRADLREAALFGTRLSGATLSGARLGGADLRCADLRGARLREAVLDGADLTNADLERADLSQSSVSHAVFDGANLSHSRLQSIRGFESARWIGVDIRNVNFTGAYLLRRFVVDQNYIQEFRDSSRWAHLVYHLWWATSDCGRSVTRWCGCILLLVALHAWLFRVVAIDFGPHDPNWLTAAYYSVVTLTTLGYGEIVPASPAAQVVAMVEVISGYVMLGGLLSIFANKFARRGD